MVFHRLLIHLSCYLCYSSTFSNSLTLLYHTENSPSVQYYDCIYYTRTESPTNIRDVKYCRQLNKNQSLQRDFNQSCHNGGQLTSFEELSGRNVSVSDVLQWSSSMEQADLYSKYLSNSSLDIGETFICNCANPASFGKFCEYEYHGDSTFFHQAITKQFQPLNTFSVEIGRTYASSQLHGNRPCYMTLECDSGLMCLDWRHICDGKQQCMDGVDEDSCEVLEFNECEDDEYRCANGMCIPEEYWLDGDYDCMDGTDEINTIVQSGDNCFNVPSFLCDEHLCPYNQWSCGDGQCVSDDTDRHKGIRIHEVEFCKNMRDVNYMCESVTRHSQSWWTIDGGYCLPYSLPYQTLRLDTTAVEDICSFSLKCALSNSLDQDCQCKNATACRSAVNALCRDSYLFYPKSGPLLSPYIDMFYARDRDWTKKKPDKLLYYGPVKCIGYRFISNHYRSYTIDETFLMYDYRFAESAICNAQEGTHGYRDYSGPHYDINCWNNSKTYNNRSYQVSFLCETRCISKYRVRDGIKDCLQFDEVYNINNSCPQIQHHRLQCSSSVLTCLLVGALGTWGPSCSNGRDEFDSKRGTFLRDTIVCKERNSAGCAYLRNYIQSSSHIDTNKTTTDDNSISDGHSTTVMPFRSYCDSFFDTKSGIDELPLFCKEWICSIDEYECLSGQCIPQSWVCDGEWDCNDGSDEQRLFIMDRFHEHNSKLINLTNIQEQCYQQYRTDNTPFSDICNLSSEYPCFRTDVDDPFNLTLHRPCIDLEQIGDGKTDCLSGLDERNRLQCSNLGMLGFHFQFNDSRCGPYTHLCTFYYPWTSGTNIAYDTVCFHQKTQFKNGTDSNCDTADDAMCLNDICLKDARCNGKMECLHGEDEYRCIPQNQSPLDYRLNKKTKQIQNLRLRNYPLPTQVLQKQSAHHPNVTDPDLLLVVGKSNSLPNLTTMTKIMNDATTVYEARDSTVQSVYDIVRRKLGNDTITFDKHYLPFICNRGLAVKYHTGHTVCFCPPSFYGSQCQFYSDRITILTHLDLVNYRSSSSHQIGVIKILTTFLFHNQIIDYHQFHVFPQLQNEKNYIKQGYYFLYPRSEVFIQIKKNNRSGTQLYSVRFEAFHLHVNETIEPIGVWKYPIYFDFLPSFGLSKILRFYPPFPSSNNGPCSTHPCGKNGTCQEVLNSNRSSYFCSCNSGYYGLHCGSYDEQCNNSCSSKSICRPKYHELSTEDQHPLCLCPVSTFGSSCHIKNDMCQKDPCLNGGSCVVTYNMANTNNYTCICSDMFEGEHCQLSKGTVNIRIVLPAESTLKASDVVGATVSFNDYQIPSLSFDVRHQQVYNSLPSHLKPIYGYTRDANAPSTAVMKIYGPNYRSEEPTYYILYYYPGQKEINVTVDLTSENHCPLVETLWSSILTNETSGHFDNSTFDSTTTVFLYHHICRVKQNINTSFTCFHDLNYLCMCEFDHYRAECFGYNHSSDHCSLCLSNGYCLQGQLNDKRDFLCLCPRCRHGKRCEYSTEVMSFTLDSLLVKDIQNNPQLFPGVYICIALLIFLFGLFNNLCSFLTFIRPKPRKLGVGNYLLIVSIVDQCSLLVLLFKMIHIILGSNGTLFHHANLNVYWCKIVSYLLSVLTRITYWLTSFVTVERLCLVLFPTSVTLKNPRLALGLSIFGILSVCAMHIHEVLHYTTIVDLSYISVNVTLCVTSYTQSFVSAYNRVNVLVHYFIPFLIQVISITITLVQTACSRARTSSSRQQTFGDLFKKQFREQKEHYVTPMIIVFSALPQTILSFTYACSELKQPWQRYTLLTAYFLSYLPQMLGFILYVIPSRTFSGEFRQTIVGKKLHRQQKRSAIILNNIETRTRSLKQTVPAVALSSTETKTNKCVLKKVLMYPLGKCRIDQI